MRTIRLLLLPIFALAAISGIVPALAVPAATYNDQVRPLQQTTTPNILCYDTLLDQRDSCERLQGIYPQQVTPVRSTREFTALGDLSPFNVIYVGPGEAQSLQEVSAQLNAYVEAGGGLIVNAPGLEGPIDFFPPGFELTIGKPARPANPALEATRLGATHPILIGLNQGTRTLPLDIIPLQTLGPAWLVLDKSVESPNASLLAGVYGKGKVVLDAGGPGETNYNSYIQQLIDWIIFIPIGPDMGITAIEVTQAVQDLNNSVDLVANKRTYVRVHVSSPTAISNVTASLAGQRGGSTLFPTLTPGNPGGTITVRPAPDRGQINDSFWFELPSSWLGAGSLTLTARLDPANAKNDPNLANNIQAVTVNLQTTPALRLRLYNVRYTIGGTTYQANTSHLDRLESWLRRAYPIATLSVTRSSFTYPDPGLPNVDTLNSRLAFIKLIRIIFAGENSRTVYYGLVDDGGGFMRGKAAGIPGVVASGPTGAPSGSFAWDTDGSYGDWYGGHEIAHTRNRYHAEFCGAGGGVAYPYSNGRISPALSGATALYGFDITTRAIYDPNWRDVMTYCQNQWVSDFTYEGIRSYITTVGLAAPASVIAANRFLLVAGQVDLDTNTGTLTNLNLIDQEAELPLPDPGDWTIALVGAGNVDLATYPFAPDELTDAEESPGRPAMVSAIVPWVEGATRIELRFGATVVDSRAVSANAPTVTNLQAAGLQQLNNAFSWTGSDADGDPLTYSVLYSNDNGANWQPLTTALDASEFTIDPAALPGGDQCRLRVIASDGALSGIADSEPFAVPTKAPLAEIVLPSDNATFFPAQPITFVGNAYDAEDGVLGDAALQWSSSLDGDLGTGTTTSTVNLSTGTHVISLTATDSEGKTSAVTRTIQIAAGTASVPVELNVAPEVIGVTTLFKSAPISSTISLRNAAESDLPWTASVDVDWAALSTTSGTTPGDIIVTIDPSGLNIGSYQGTITIQSEGATNSPRSIPVVLEVTGEQVYIALISR
jgi:hypothetical protein